mmetsp:Transcript_35714/g.114269  ORF Transcript_35714/g.114269 Transcript_35714/m.114269 type:complete len:320 (+) Transcript_35714:1144-2103(+)
MAFTKLWLWLWLWWLVRASSASSYDLVVFTAAFGDTYEELASRWCRSVRRHVTGPLLGLATKTVVLAAREVPGCDVEVVEAERVKALKMTRLPLESKVYAWLDVDVLPVAERAAWFRGFLRSVVRSQGTAAPVLKNRTIALTRTRKKDKVDKFNGGFFLYADHSCLDDWRREFLRQNRSRDQPALRAVAATDDCDVLELPEKTQGFFSTNMALKTFLLPTNRRQAFARFAFIHFTGNAHGPNRILIPLANVDHGPPTGRLRSPSGRGMSPGGWLWWWLLFLLSSLTFTLTITLLCRQLLREKNNFRGGTTPTTTKKEDA